MAPEPERTPAAAGLSGVPVKPASEAFDRQSIPAAWLDDDTITDLNDRVDRLAADYEWVNDLALFGYRGPPWEFFVEELAKYGMGVLTGWMKSGAIWGKCRERGYGGLPELQRSFERDEASELAMETVAKALHHFRVDVLMKKKWDYRRGATLRTYFIGQCLIRFANIYRKWWNNEALSRRALLADDPHLNLTDPRVESPEEDAITHYIALEALSRIKSPKVQMAALLRATGQTYAEIAIALACTENAVELMLRRERARQQKLGE